MRLLLCVLIGWASGAVAKTKCAPGFEEASGVLFDEDGRPVAEASIELFPLDDFDSFTNPVEGTDNSFHSAELSADGKWSVPCVRKGAYEVEVESWNFAPVLARGVTGTPTHVSVRAQGAVLAGRLVAAPGVPAKNVRASITFSTEKRSVRRWRLAPRKLRIEDDFSFKTPPLSDGSWLFSAYDFSGRRVEHTFEVRNGKTGDLQVAFKLAVIRGTVLDKNGAPVADAGVSAKAESMFEEIARSGCGTVMGRRGFLSNTDDRGRFVIPDLSAIEKYRLESRGAGGESETVGNVVAPTDGVNLVIDRNTEPGVLIVPPVARGAQLELRRPRDFPDSEPQKNGPVRFDRVPPGVVELDIFAAGKAARSVQAKLEPGAELTLDPIALLPERPLKVRVFNEVNGAPLSGARVLLENRLWQRAQVAFDEETRNSMWLQPATTSEVLLRGLSPGPIAFSVYVEGYAIARMVARATQKELDVRLKPHGPTVLTLLARDGGVQKATLPLVDPGLHVVVPQGKKSYFPTWYTSGTDGGAVTAFEAMGGVSLRVSAFSTFHSELHFWLIAGEFVEPRGRNPFGVLEEAGIRPRWLGQSGAQFVDVRPGTYTVLVYEPENRLGETLRYRVWRRVLELGEGRVTVDLESFEQRPELIRDWPPPDPTSPNPSE